MAQGISYSKTLLTHKLLMNSVPSVTSLGDELLNEENEIGCHISDVMAQFIIVTRASSPSELPVGASIYGS